MENFILDIKDLSTPQLKSIRQTIKYGVEAMAEHSSNTSETTDEKAEIENLEEKIEDTETIDSTESKIEEANVEKEGDGIADVSNEIKAMEVKISELEDYKKVVEEAIKPELESLWTYKADREKADARATLLVERKKKVEEAGLDIDIDADTDRWLDTDEPTFTFMLDTLAKVKKADASVKTEINVPDSISSDTDIKGVFREGLKERKAAKSNEVR